MRSRRKVALITGGSRGIGRSVALALAKEKGHIIINYLRNNEAAYRTARDLRRLGAGVTLIRGNIALEDDQSELFKLVVEKFKTVDIFVHCASLGIFKSLLKISRAGIDRVIQVNTTSFIGCVQKIAPLMPYDGRIVALSSLGSSRYISDYGSVGVAKAALEASVRYLAVDLAAKGIRVNAVAGGPVETASLRHFSNYHLRKAECIKATPFRRLGTTRDIAKVVLFLCREKPLWICGQTILVDGGLSLPILSQ